MGWRPLAAALLIAASLAAPHASAATAQEFLDMCAGADGACAARIKAERDAMEAEGAKVCLPDSMADDGLAGEVTYWLTEQLKLPDAKSDAKSIRAALIALYSCAQTRPPKGETP